MTTICITWEIFWGVIGILAGVPILGFMAGFIFFRLEKKFPKHKTPNRETPSEYQNWLEENK